MNVPLDECLKNCVGLEYLETFQTSNLPHNFKEFKFAHHENMIRFFVENEALFHRHEIRTKVIGLSMLLWKREYAWGGQFS